MQETRTIAWGRSALAVLAATLVALCVAAVPALANKTLTTPVNPATGERMTVSDDITRLHVTKLEEGTHEYVEGATLAIIEKDTGKVVDEWVTGSSTHENEKGLDVNVVYVLRELKAPDGYEVVDDIEFVVNEMEGTGVRILSADNGQWELTESYKLNIYDPAEKVERETIVHEQREGAGSSSSSSSSSSSVAGKDSPKTGDTSPVVVVALVALAALAIVIFAVVSRRKSGKHAK